MAIYADLTLDIQRIKTNMFRGVLDSLAESINPKTVVNELMTNLDDAMNDDLGATTGREATEHRCRLFLHPLLGQDASPAGSDA